MMQNRFDIQNPSPLRAELRPFGATAPANQLQGVQSTPGGLIRATIGSAVAATAILIFFYLPAEFGIDPTGMGGLLGLTEMGQIKTQLAAEAAADEAAATTAAPVAVLQGTAGAADPAILARLAAIESQLAAIAVVVGADQVASAAPVPDPAPAPVAAEPAPMVAEPEPVPEPAPEATATAQAPEGWRNEVNYTLAPGEGVEIKLVMQQGATASFEWTANGSVVNYETHGDDGGTNNTTYEEGRAVPERTGTLTAAFTGNHGWFWRNRSDVPVTLTLRTAGEYSEFKAP